MPVMMNKSPARRARRVVVPRPARAACCLPPHLAPGRARPQPGLSSPPEVHKPWRGAPAGGGGHAGRVTGVLAPEGPALQRRDGAAGRRWRGGHVTPHLLPDPRAPGRMKPSPILPPPPCIPSSKPIVPNSSPWRAAMACARSRCSGRWREAMRGPTAMWTCSSNRSPASPSLSECWR